MFLFCLLASLLVLTLYCVYYALHGSAPTKRTPAKRLENAALGLPAYPQYEHLPTAVLIVGASGGLGRHVVNMFLSQKRHSVRVIGLDVAPMPWSDLPGYTHVCGSATDSALIARLLAEHRISCIVSSIMPNLRTAPAAAFRAINVDAVHGLLACASAAPSVTSFVHISSIAVTDHYLPSRAATEADALPPRTSYRSVYDCTKREGEDLVLAASSRRLRTIALRMGGILSDPDAVAVQECFAEPVLRPLLGAAPIDHLHGVDAAHAVGCAASALADGSRAAAAAGQAFFITAFPTTSALTSEVLHVATGKPVQPVPQAVVEILKIVFGAVHAVRGALGLPRPGISTADFLRMTYVEKTFSCQKAAQLIGWKPLCPDMHACGRALTAQARAEGRLYL